MSNEATKVVVGVVPRERWSLSVPSLTSLLPTLAPDMELVYVDGGSPDRIATELRDLVEAHGGRYLRYYHVLACSEARNIIVAQTDSEYVVFAENDVSFRPGWIEALVACADETGAGAVQPLVLMGSDDDTELIHIGYGQIEINDGVLDTNLHEHEWDVLSEVPEQTRRPTGQMEFHAFLTRRAMLDEIGPFDERIRSIADHEDLVLTAREAGWEFFYEPASEVVFLQFAHLTAEDRGFWQLHWSEEWIEQSIDHFARKWSVRTDVGWPEEARRWSSQRRTMWYIGTPAPLAFVGKVFRKLLFHPHLTALVRGPEYRLMARPGQREDRRRRAALAGDTMPSPTTSTAGA